MGTRAAKRIIVSILKQNWVFVDILIFELTTAGLHVSNPTEY